ncbi:MAG: hypothetical protein DWQ34_11540 [Planctomycetota bacterium]|nr:MAG: hypothetical protein DWQ34_11540 [Planctomycetota bacterium]REK30083.1 MAG: hypothetical protein DWQ41_02845 [Planctomycetota bacterium]REK37675.1 MAG: hypothetical protein DWQ45_06680 [Planctomycetota bacterium]
MAFSDADDRTNAPSPRRLEEARNAGQVPRSIPFTSAAVLLAASLTFWILGPNLWAAGRELFNTTLAATSIRFDAQRPAETIQILEGSIDALSIGAAGVLFVVVLSAVAANVVQFGFRVTPSVVSPDLGRIHPATGIRRVLSGGWWRAAQFLVRLVAVALITGSCIAAIGPELARLPSASEATLPDFFGAAVLGLTLKLSIGFLGLAAIDVSYHRWRYRRQLSMSPEEARDEARHSARGRGFRGLSSSGREHAEQVRPVHE